jgi:hypothetical protein
MTMKLKICSRDGWTAWAEDGSTMPFGEHEGEPIDKLPASYCVWLLLEFAPTFEDDDNGLFDAIEDVLNGRGFERKSGIRKTPIGVMECEWFEKTFSDGKVARVPW